MIKMGMKPSKLIVGLPLYGRTFFLEEPAIISTQEQPRLGASAKNVGFQGPFTRENGFMGYNEVIIAVNSNIILINKKIISL